MEDLVPSFQDPREGGGRPQTISTFLPGGGSGHPYFWIRGMGGNPTDGPFPPQVGKKTVRNATVETERWDLGIPPSGRCRVDGGAGDNGDVHLQI